MLVAGPGPTLAAGNAEAGRGSDRECRHVQVAGAVEDQTGGDRHLRHSCAGPLRIRVTSPGTGPRSMPSTG